MDASFSQVLGWHSRRAISIEVALPAVNQFVYVVIVEGASGVFRR